MHYAFKMNQVQEVGRMYQAGRSLGQIAAHFGVSVTAVRSALKVLDIQPRSRAEGARLHFGVWLEWNGRRMTLGQWAQHLGRPRDTVASRYRAGKPIAEILR
jgi:hypothetical protein